MTIRKGEEWGDVGPAPDGLVLAADDASVRRVVDDARRAGVPVPPIGLQGGDLFRAVGGVSAGDRLRGGGDVARLPCDLLRVTLDDHTCWGVAHVVARRPVLGSAALGWWHGALLAVMNVSEFGAWDVAPRAHPNDGTVDVVEVDPAMTLRERWQARGRLALGTHVPHPRIGVRRTAGDAWDLASGTVVWVDGVRIGTGALLRVDVEPDGAFVHV